MTIRVLGLPGYAQNGDVLKGKLKAAQAIWGDEVELITMEPPHVLRVPTLTNSSLSSASRPEADASPAVNPSSASESARRWWNWLNHRTFEEGDLEEVVRSFREFWEREGPFDAIFGFSQGAAAAGILLSLLENPHLHPLWSAPPSSRSATAVEWPPKPVKCAVLVAAFGPANGWGFKGFREGRPKTPTLHFIGKNDVVVNIQHTLDTAAWNVNPTIVWHNGGHHIPRKPYYAHLTKDFLTLHCLPPSHDADVDSRAHSIEDLRTAGWGTPTESVSSSLGEGHEDFLVRAFSPVEEEARI